MIVLEDDSKKHSSDGSYLESMDTILGIFMVWCVQSKRGFTHKMIREQ